MKNENKTKRNKEAEGKRRNRIQIHKKIEAGYMRIKINKFKEAVLVIESKFQNKIYYEEFKRINN